MLQAKVLAFSALLVIQTGVALLFKLSQHNGKYAFSPGSAQTSAEAIKLCISAAFYARDTLLAQRIANDVKQPLRVQAKTVWDAFRQQVNKQLLLHAGGLACLYAFINQLAFALFRWADAATITLIKSASSFVSAILLWLLLSRPIAPLQWIAILLQVLGLFIVQYDDCKHAALLQPDVYMALVCSLLISSGAGVWNEHVLKTLNVPMHVQNCCLYSFGVFLNLLVFCFMEQQPAEVPLLSAYFRGYDAAAIGIICCQAVLGLVITAVLKHADMVIRSFATACSISVLYAVNVLFLGWTTNLTYLAGCAVVFLSTYLYMALGAQPVSSELRSAVVGASMCIDPAEPKPGINVVAASWLVLPQSMNRHGAATLMSSCLLLGAFLTYAVSGV